MKRNREFRHWIIGLLAAQAVTALSAVLALYEFTGQVTLVLGAVVTLAVMLIWTCVLLWVIQRRLTQFTQTLCVTLDQMMDGETLPPLVPEEETIDARVNHRLRRLYGVMQQGKQQAERDRAELQSLLSDISHQLKTPLASLKMLNDTMQSRSIPEDKRLEFMQTSGRLLDQLDFLMAAMVKSSRLEAGMIVLEKREASVKETLALAISGLLEAMERKNIEFYVECSEKLQVFHDVKWTAEAIANLLDNAIKYTPENGTIQIRVIPWEMYVRIDVCDTGRGIPESQYGAIFRRFYREPEVHDVEGVGIGLYLTREIIMQQGGYVTVSSKPGVGSVFSVFLPRL